MRRAWPVLMMLLALAQAGAAQVGFEPGLLVLDLDAGDAPQVTVLVRNGADAAKDFRLQLEYRTPGPCTRPAGEWAAVAPAELSLGPGEAEPVTVSLRAPGREVRGECVLFLFAAERVQAQIPLNLRTGMPVFLRLNHENRVAGDIADVAQARLANGDLSLAVDVKNTGRLHLAPHGTAWIEDASGRRTWEARLTPRQPIMAGARGTLRWQGPAPGAAGERLGVKLYWDTLYGQDKLGAPESAQRVVPLTVAARPTEAR